MSRDLWGYGVPGPGERTADADHLNNAIADFGQHGYSQESGESYGDCVSNSLSFLQSLHPSLQPRLQKFFHPTMEAFPQPPRRDLKPSDDEPGHWETTDEIAHKTYAPAEHYSPVVHHQGQDYVVDWTLNQFDPHAQVPHVEPLDNYRNKFSWDEPTSEFDDEWKRHNAHRTAARAPFNPLDDHYFPDYDYGSGVDGEIDDDEADQTDMRNAWLIGEGSDRRKPHLQRGVRYGPPQPDDPGTDTEKWLQNVGHEFTKRIHAAEPSDSHLYRGMAVPPEWIDKVRQDGSVSLPLSSFSPFAELAYDYSRPDPTRGWAPRRGNSVILKVEPGSKSVPLIDDENVSHGDFDVIGVHEMTDDELQNEYGNDPAEHTPTTVIHLRHRSVPVPVDHRTSHRTAMPAPLPEGLTFHYHPDDSKLPELPDAWGGTYKPPAPAVTAHLPGVPEPVGHLSWYDHDDDIEPGEVADVHVHDDYRRHGIATAMYDWVRANIQPQLHHSDTVTDLGDLWVSHEQSRHAHRTAMPTYYHLTNDPNFKLNPNFVPDSPNGEPGIFVTPHSQLNKFRIEYGWDRPYTVPIHVPHDLDDAEWDYDGDGDEEDEEPYQVFVPAHHFDKLDVGLAYPTENYDPKNSRWSENSLWPHNKKARPHTAHRTAMPYYHNTDAELNPGDLVLPAAERGHESQWKNNSDYDPHSVYFTKEDNDDWAEIDRGRNRYEVEPIGEVQQDPEHFRHLRDFEEENGRPWDAEIDSEEDVMQNSYKAPRARVVRKLPFRNDQYDHPDHPDYERFNNPIQLPPDHPAMQKIPIPFNREARFMSAAVTVYTQPNCVQCTMTKRQLDKLGIAHDTVDVTADPDAHAYVRGLGYTAAPVVVVNNGESHWAGFRPERLKELVGGE